MRHLLTFLFIVCPTLMVAQQNMGSIKGQITNSLNEPIAFANITLLNSEEAIIRTTSDFDGLFVLEPIPPGAYTLKYSMIGYDTLLIKELEVLANEITFLKNELPSLSDLGSIELSYNDSMMIDEEVFESLLPNNYQEYAEYSPAEIVKTTGIGTFSKENSRSNIKVRCVRPGSSLTFIDGKKVISKIPKTSCADAYFTLKMSGLSAQYSNAKTPLFQSDISKEVMQGRLIIRPNNQQFR